MDLDRSALQRLAARLIETGWAPAMAFALTDPERTLASQTYGAAAPDALWPIGSIGKSFTAVIALQLVEEGLLDLGAPVTDYLPWWSVQSRFAPITMHHLLTHTSGLIADSDRAPASNWDVLALADTETGFEPGEHRHYSNIGYRRAGVVLEAVSGRPYGELIQERVLDRAGLSASSPIMLHDTRRRLLAGHVPFYDDRPWRPRSRPGAGAVGRVSRGGWVLVLQRRRPGRLPARAVGRGQSAVRPEPRPDEGSAPPARR